jgi:hypothetical protein
LNADTATMLGIAINALLGIISIVINYKNAKDIKYIKNIVNNNTNITGNNTNIAGFANCSNITDSQSFIGK